MQSTEIPCFDPRDLSQQLHDSATWKLTSNPALVQATLALDLVPTKKIDWNKVAKIAELCEAPA